MKYIIWILLMLIAFSAGRYLSTIDSRLERVENYLSDSQKMCVDFDTYMIQ